MPGRDDELLTAYLDGVAELSPDERRRAEAALVPGEADATRALLGQLRALPPAAAEPDWAAMERAISLAVGTRVPRPWWRPSWKWVLPVVACGAAAVAIGLAVRHDDAPAPLAHLDAPRPAHGVPVARADARPDAPLVYLDGETLDIDAVDPAVLDEPDPVVADEDSLLPTEQWIDRLDDRALDRAERVLAKRKKS